MCTTSWSVDFTINFAVRKVGNKLYGVKNGCTLKCLRDDKPNGSLKLSQILNSFTVDDHG